MWKRATQMHWVHPHLCQRIRDAVIFGEGGLREEDLLVVLGKKYILLGWHISGKVFNG
jgi:hypothetical protein